VDPTATTIESFHATAGFAVFSYREQLYRQPHAHDLIDMIYLCRKTAAPVSRL
jgi:hypothetical protein